MYRRKKRCRSSNGVRVHGPTADLLSSRPHAENNSQQQQQQQEEEVEATSVIQLMPISSTTLANQSDMTLIRNPYYLFTDPSYCLANIDGVDRNCLTLNRQVTVHFKV